MDFLSSLFSLFGGGGGPTIPTTNGPLNQSGNFGDFSSQPSALGVPIPHIPGVDYSQPVEQQSQLGGLLDKLNDPGLQKQLSAAAGSPTATPGGSTPVQPIQVAPPNYSGSGPNAGLLQGLQGALNPSAPLSTAGGPAPLGPAAINPLLMLLRARLGVQ